MDEALGRQAQPLLTSIDNLNRLIATTQDAIVKNGTISDIKVRIPAVLGTDGVTVLTPEHDETLLVSEFDVATSKRLINLILTIFQGQLTAAQSALAAL